MLFLSEVKVGDRVYYDHKGRHRLGADDYSMPAIVVRVGRKRVTVRRARDHGLLISDGELKSVDPLHLRRRFGDLKPKYNKTIAKKEVA